MKYFTLFFFWSVCLAPPSSAQENLPILVRELQHSVVTIIVRNENKQIIGQGSGFFVNAEGHVITNRHVLDGAVQGEVKTATGRIFPIINVVAEDKEADLVRVTINRGIEFVKPVRISRSLP